MPNYRVPFMEALRERLASSGIAVAVAHGAPVDNLAARNDAATPDWMHALSTRSLRVGSRTLVHRAVSDLLLDYSPDAVIAEQAIRNVENLELFRYRRKSSTHLAFWGHGRSYSTVQSPFEASVKQSLTQRANWFFSYTEGGAQHVIKQGYPASQVTVVNNTLDTTSLLADADNLAGSDMERFADAHDLTRGKTALYIGGIDKAKGIQFLMDAANQIGKLDREFRLLVAGDGALANYVLQKQAEGSPVRMLGRITGPAKALALRSCDFLMIPRWVGLVAIDSLALGKPIITVKGNGHSPEFEYLAADDTVVLTDYDLKSYVDGVIRLIQNPDIPRQMGEKCVTASRELTLEAMVCRFAGGVETWLNLG